MTTEAVPDSEVMCYVGRKPCCGHLVAVTVDHPDSKNRNAREVGNWIRQGMSVERVTLETVHGLKFQRCECKKAKTTIGAAP